MDEGCGIGIWAGNGGGSKQHVTIPSSSVHDGDGSGIFAGSGPTPSSHCHGLEIETVLSRHPRGPLGWCSATSTMSSRAITCAVLAGIFDLATGIHVSSNNVTSTGFGGFGVLLLAGGTVRPNDIANSGNGIISAVAAIEFSLPRRHGGAQHDQRCRHWTQRRALELPRLEYLRQHWNDTLRWLRRRGSLNLNASGHAAGQAEFILAMAHPGQSARFAPVSENGDVPGSFASSKQPRTRRPRALGRFFNNPHVPGARSSSSNSDRVNRESRAMQTPISVTFSPTRRCLEVERWRLCDGLLGMARASDSFFDPSIYYGIVTPVQDANGLRDNPQLVAPGDPGEGTLGMQSLAWYHLRPGSPAPKSGRPRTDNGGRDFLGGECCVRVHGDGSRRCAGLGVRRARPLTGEPGG